jgi:hypothetical protein
MAIGTKEFVVASLGKRADMAELGSLASPLRVQGVGTQDVDILGVVEITHGKTIKSVTGSGNSTQTVVAAVGGKRIKVFAVELLTASVNVVTVTFKSGAGGTALRTYPLQASTGAVTGLVASVEPPGWFFGTAAGDLLEIAFSAAETVTWNLSYFDDDAS